MSGVARVLGRSPGCAFRPWAAPRDSTPEPCPRDVETTSWKKRRVLS